MNTPQVVSISLRGHADVGQYPPLPITIVDLEDRVVMSGVLTTGSRWRISPEPQTTQLFAKLNLPNGQTRVKPLHADDGWHPDVEFTIGTESPHEWMAWSAPRVDLKHTLEPLMAQPGMSQAWIQKWELDPDARHWVQRPVERYGPPPFDRAFQLEFPASALPSALVVHLGTGSPQVIALPPRRRCMALVTTAHALSTEIAARVLIGGYGAAAEGMLEFLRQGAMGLAGALLDPGSDTANRLLRDKMDDPIGATAAVYYLLRKRDWDRLPPAWLENLASRFAWIPDVHLVLGASRIERGVDALEAPALAARCLKSALGRGLPLFAEAAWLLADLLAYARRAEGPAALTLAQLTLIQSMLAASRPAGLTFGYLGQAPHKPLSAQEAFEASESHELEQRFRISNLDLAWPLLAAQADTEPTLRSIVANDKRSSVPGNARTTLFVADIYPGASPAHPTRRSADDFARSDPTALLERCYAELTRQLAFYPSPDKTSAVLSQTDGTMLITLSCPSPAVFRDQLKWVDESADQRADRAAEVLTQLSLPAFMAAVLGLDTTRTPRSIQLLELCLSLGTQTALRFKETFGCPRPAVLSVRIQPLIAAPNSSAFPGGFATAAYLLAEVLPTVLGAHSTATVSAVLEAVARRVAKNREVAGINFPVDSSAGRVLGLALADFMLADCLAEPGTDGLMRSFRFEPKEIFGLDHALDPSADLQLDTPLRRFVVGTKGSPLTSTEGREAWQWLWSAAKSEWAGQPMASLAVSKPLPSTFERAMKPLSRLETKELAVAAINLERLEWGVKHFMPMLQQGLDA